MEDPNPLGPQPDFNLLGQYLISAANEIKKAQNLPAITAGERILVELQQMRQEFRQELQQTRQEFRQELQQMGLAIRQDFATIITASNHNNAARVQNSYVTDRSTPLLPFLNPSTGAIIAGFPATSAEIERMSEQEVSGVIQQLGLPAIATSLVAKRRQLRGHIGLKAQGA